LAKNSVTYFMDGHSLLLYNYIQCITKFYVMQTEANVSGIVVTVKQRQEFRIRLQKRARRTAEKKMESFEEERHAKTVKNYKNQILLALPL